MDIKMKNTNVFNFYSNVAEKKVDWLWYPYIPYGKITLIEGDPGEGKSTFMINLAALLTKGEPMPDGFKTPKPITVVYQCNEDDIYDTIKPRLLSANADCAKIAYIIDEENPLDLEDERIECAIAETGARLLILDPFQSFLSQNNDLQNSGRMRFVLGKLSDIAAKYNCAVVLIGHMNKSKGSKSLYRGMGSIDIAAIARSVLMITRDSDDGSTRYMLPIKSNLAPIGLPIEFHFNINSGFEWIGQCDANISTEITESSTPNKRAITIEMLSSFLHDGPKPCKQIFEHLETLGISERTAYKAKKEMGIISYRTDTTWYWELPNKEGNNENED